MSEFNLPPGVSSSMIPGNEPLERECECEHMSHFDHQSGHDYGKAVPEAEITIRQLPFGIYRVCKECAEKHYTVDMENEWLAEQEAEKHR